MDIKDIRQLLESPYNQKEWKVFLQSHFTNGKLFGDAHSIELTDKNLCKKCYSLGNYEVNEYTKIGIFEVQLNDNVKLTRNRVGLRNLIKSITAQVAGAMVVFVQGDKWRFSYISKRKVKNKETNTIEDKETAPKRYTYLFGKNEKALTAAIRFHKLIQKQQGNLYQYLTLNDFEEAFSVEKLSKDFFNEYKKSYEDFVEFITGKRYVKKGNKFVETVIHPANFQLRNLFGNDEKQARDFCKRMMGRIVFLYFIQKKGWLAVAQGKKWGEGNQDYLFDLYRTSKHKDDFYTQELVPLFFKTLNNTNSEKETNTLRFPYLNGGLFDDSHDRKFNKLAMPTEIFENLFNTFNNFNFTIYEDAPDEHTVAVDPEMLGHIFENLLEDNKDKGAFYTPKEIVHYMCRESLFQYIINNEELKIKNEDDRAAIKKIIEQTELTKEEIAFAEKNAFKIIDALEQVKICDPAIGSGAFPMGLLQEIFNTQIYLQELKGFTRKQTEAEIKKHIIEESIYGVDIDAGAVDIARLRFWLSLVVDETEPQPLPNLSFKIVCANTLIPLG
ncbi:MAG: DNA modification methylase, partial [Bacteroidetes bacterium]|nr:DNA modification methylase [Bacteroidota bacterium]